MTERPCPLCDSRSYTSYLAKHPGLIRCTTCGLVTWDRLEEPEELERLYNEQVFSPMEYYMLSLQADLRTFREVFRQIRQRVSPGRLLDVGCASGAFMTIAQENHWQPEGIDLNRKVVEFCVSHWNLSATYGTLESGKYPEGTFLMVHMGDVLEHVREPLALLEAARQVLRPGGWVVISTPNIDSWAAKTFQIKRGEHLFYFNRETMRRGLQRAGFTEIAVDTHDRYRSLAGLSESSTFTERHLARSVLMGIRRLIPESFSFKIPFQENLLAFAKK